MRSVERKGRKERRMGEITLIEIIIAVIFVGGIVFSTVFSMKIDLLTSRVEYLEAILRIFQEDARKNNDG